MKTTTFKVQFTGLWAGGCSLNGWSPVATGIESYSAAQRLLEDEIFPQLTDAQSDGAADFSPRFEIVEE